MSYVIVNRSETSFALGGSLRDVLSNFVTEHRLNRKFGKPTFDGIEPEKGYSGCWHFKNTSTNKIFSVYFRWDAPRIGACPNVSNGEIADFKIWIETSI